MKIATPWENYPALALSRNMEACVRRCGSLIARGIRSGYTLNCAKAKDLPDNLDRTAAGDLRCYHAASPDISTIWDAG